MEALSVNEVSRGLQWQYEPKWDGFRCLAFRYGDKVTLQSKAGKPLTRYFPDVVEAVLQIPAKTFVLDGEIVVPDGKAFSFDALLQRIHPAATRIQKLSHEMPALLIVFDLLAEGGAVLTNEVLPVRRKRLEAFAKQNFAKNPRIPTIAFDHQARRGQEMAFTSWRDARRHYSERARCPLLVR
jgi:ATP-dependent DNA ligase